MRKIKNTIVLVTYAVFGAVVVFGEVVTVGDDHSPAPHIQLPAHNQITVLIEVMVDSSCLQERERRERMR